MNVYISNLNLKFANGTTYTVREAFNQGYIEPLVLYESGQTAGRSYLWQGISNIIDRVFYNTKLSESRSGVVSETVAYGFTSVP